MAVAPPIDLDHVLLDPRSVFKEPAEVLARADLDATHKSQIPSGGATTPWSCRLRMTRP
jgi:hypothetical protein